MDLFAAAQAGNAQLAAASIEAGANVNFMVDGNSLKSYTALHEVASGNSSGHTKVALLLLQAGSNVNAFASTAAGVTFLTPLHIAAMAGRVKLAQVRGGSGLGLNRLVF